MANPRIGIFGALVAVGGVIAWRWAQRHRASQARLAQELSRWEDEGGALASVAQAAPAAGGHGISLHAVPNGAAEASGTRDVWRFPHS
jgi:hypothetical protein